MFARRVLSASALAAACAIAVVVPAAGAESTITATPAQSDSPELVIAPIDGSTNTDNMDLTYACGPDGVVGISGTGQFPYNDWWWFNNVPATISGFLNVRDGSYLIAFDATNPAGIVSAFDVTFASMRATVQGGLLQSTTAGWTTAAGVLGSGIDTSDEGHATVWSDRWVTLKSVPACSKKDIAGDHMLYVKGAMAAGVRGKALADIIQDPTKFGPYTG